MKKLTAIVLTLLLCIGLLAGCGVTIVQHLDSTDPTPTPDTTDPAAEESPEATEPADERVTANPVVEVPEGQLAMGFYMVAAYDSSYSGSKSASADAAGLALPAVDIYAVTINSEGVIVDY